MNKIDVEPTAQIIDQAIVRIQSAVRELEFIAKNMRSREDLTYASEAIGIIVNLPQQLRVDLLVTRPIRELQKLDQKD